MSNTAHHPTLRRNQQQHHRQSRPVPKLQNLARMLVCFHAAKLARRPTEVLIDKLYGSIGLNNAPAEPRLLMNVDHVPVSQRPEWADPPQGQRGMARSIEMALVPAQQEVEGQVGRRIPQQKRFRNGLRPIIRD